MKNKFRYVCSDCRTQYEITKDLMLCISIVLDEAENRLHTAKAIMALTI
ncbi:MAG: hypothetical protein WC557_11245 [Ignavibacteriaceae bacterium]